MIRLVYCECYSDFVLYMKNTSLHIFYGGTTGCINSISEIMCGLYRLCTDYIAIESDSAIIVCFNCLKEQIRIRILILSIILVFFVNGEEYLFRLCLGISYMSGIYFAYWLHSHFCFQQKIKKLELDLEEIFLRQKPLLQQTSK